MSAAALARAVTAASTSSSIVRGDEGAVVELDELARERFGIGGTDVAGQVCEQRPGPRARLVGRLGGGAPRLRLRGGVHERAAVVAGLGDERAEHVEHREDPLPG